MQKYIETLDVLKIRNSTIENAPLQQQQKITAGEKMQINSNQRQQEQNRKHRLAMVKPVVVTSNWETFDAGMSTKMSYQNSESAVNYGTNNTSSRPRWEYFV